MIKNNVELIYYSLVIILNERSGSCNVLSPKICVRKEIKDIYVKEFNMIRNKDEAKALVEHISRCKCKFNHATCKSKEKRNNKTCQ